MNATPRHTNALARESSPYLLQHAHNPVDWHPWGPTAFELARRLDRPIFLSVGYSTCYWCHVMERQCFENEAIAALMNEHFVNVKVDREERPDVDDIYMTAVQLTTRRGGWPMSVFLTPDRLLPFWCGTYLPPQAAHGMASFPQVLRGVAEAWRQRRQDVVEQARRIADAVRQTLTDRETAGPLSLQLVANAANQLLGVLDPEHGGFGSAPKFPQPDNLLFLIDVHRSNPDANVWSAIARTLDRMARGGMYDQIGGGFHRYSTDERWLVPHFEKMLYENAQLVLAYAEAHMTRPPADDPRFYADVVRHTVAYVLREMTDPSGGAFWSAQDAEVDAREGGNYVWTAAEVRAAVDPELAELALSYYGLDEGPNFRDPHHPDAEPVNVLHVPVPPAEFAARRQMSLDELLSRIERIDQQLKVVRDRRKQPTKDDKTIVSWNGLMISGLATAARLLNEPAWADAAARAADFVLANTRTDDGGLHRTWRRGLARHTAVLEDYAMFARGLLALHRTTGEPRWLDAGRQIVEAAIDRFAAPGGGYFDTLEGQSDLFVRTRTLHDGALPCGASVLVHALLDLHEQAGEARWLDRAMADLGSYGKAMADMGAGMVHMHHALLRAARQGAALDEAAAPPSRPGVPLAVRCEPPAIALSDEPQTVRVIIQIPRGHHLNAPQSADQGLTPVALILDGRGVELDVAYPPGVERRYAFADKPLRVYEGELVLTASLRRRGEGTGRAMLGLRYQACTDRECLAPATIEVPLKIER